MSEGNWGAWVSDLDRWVGYPDDEYDYDHRAIKLQEESKREQERLDFELEEIGDIQLLAGKATSAQDLYRQGVKPFHWRHALHKAVMAIGYESDEPRQYTDRPETRFVKGMLDLGRAYAIARYTRWERLDYSSALTATLPYGIRALVNQLLAAEGIARTQYADASIRAALGPKDGMTAYSRTALLQAALHRVADDTPTHPGGARLDRERMRVMLSLARLHFSTIELKLMSIDELRLLLTTYEAERATAGRDETRITTNGRLIRGWRQRHIQSLVNLYPYAIRHGLRRALVHQAGSFDRTALANELALAHCGILRMRRSR